MLIVQVCKCSNNCKDQVELPISVQYSGHIYMKFCKRCYACEFKKEMEMNESSQNIRVEEVSSLKDNIDILDSYFDMRISSLDGELEAYNSLKTAIQGTGMFIELSCPLCKEKLLSRVTLEQRR